MSYQETKLITSKDWDAWLNVVKGKSTGYHVWGLVNPALDTKPESFPKPVKPVKPQHAADTAMALVTRDYADYKTDLSEYKADLAEWEKQQASFTKLIDFFYASVSKANAVYLEGCKEVHPWDYLRALKTKLAPSGPARKIALEKDYNRVKAGPGSRQSPEAWIDDQTHIVARAKDQGLAEATDDERLFRDFALAIESYAPTLSQVCQFGIIKLTNYVEALTEAEEQFRQFVRLYEKKKTGSHTVFATGNTNNNTDSNTQNNTANAKSGETKPTYKGKTAEPAECLCGVKYWFSQYDYLRSDRPNRP